MSLPSSSSSAPSPLSSSSYSVAVSQLLLHYHNVILCFGQAVAIIVRIVPNDGQSLLSLLRDGVGVFGFPSTREEVRTPQILEIILRMSK